MTTAARSWPMGGARVRLGLIAVAVALAGCSEAGGKGDDVSQAATQLDLAATSATGVIRGVVVDEAVRPVAGATVELTGGTAGGDGSTQSNDEGAFGFEALQPGTYFLQVSAEDYTSVQQSADVVAGVSDPQPLRVMLVALPRLEPFIESLQVKMFISGAGWVDGVGGVTAGGLGVLDGNYVFGQEITPDGAVAQTEFVWEKTSELGTTAMVSGGTYDDDGDSVETSGWTGPSPLVSRVNATAADDTATQISYSFWAWPTSPLPAGVHANQPVDVFMTVFHNFRPDDGWTFTGSGAHALPPP